MKLTDRKLRHEYWRLRQLNPEQYLKRCATQISREDTLLAASIFCSWVWQRTKNYQFFAMAEELLDRFYSIGDEDSVIEITRKDGDLAHTHAGGSMHFSFVYFLDTARRQGVDVALTSTKYRDDQTLSL